MAILSSWLLRLFMDESVLLRTAWVCAILGLGGLLIYSLLVDAGEKELLFLDDNPVTLEGTIKRIQHGKTTFMLFQPDIIDAVAFKETDAVKGDKVMIKGRFSVYKGKKELIIDRMIKK